MPYTPLAIPDSALADLPDELPVWSKAGDSGALHGRQSCPALTRTVHVDASTLPIVDGEPTAPYHCAGAAPEWKAFRQYQRTRQAVEQVNAAAYAAWTGDIAAYRRLRLYDRHDDPADIRAYAEDAVVAIRAEGAITDQTVLIAILKDAISRMMFNTRLHGGVAELIGERAAVDLAVAAACEPRFVGFHNLVRQWADNGRSAVDTAATVIVRQTVDDVERGKRALLGGLPDMDVAAVADALEASFTAYLAEATVGAPVIVTLPGDLVRDVPEVAYLLTGYRRNDDGSTTFPLPLNAYIALREAGELDTGLVHVEQDGRTLDTGQLWNLVTAHTAAERERTRQRRDAQADAHQAAQAARRETRRLSRAYAWQQAAAGVTLDEDVLTVLDSSLEDYIAAHADQAVSDAINAHLTPVPPDCRAMYLRALKAGTTGSLATAMLTTDSAVLQLLVERLFADAVMASHHEVLAWAAGMASATHKDQAAEWAAGLGRPVRTISARGATRGTVRSVTD